MSLKEIMYLVFCAIIVLVFSAYVIHLVLDIIRIIKNHNNPEVEKHDSINAELVSLMLQDNFVAKVNLLIDSIIREHAEVYQVMVLSVNEDKAQYITTEEQDKMQEYVIHMTLKNISPELMSIIKLVYNIDEAKDLKDLISIRTKMYLINFIVEYNADVTE